MTIAYLILAHNTPNHLSRLIHALDSPKVLFFVHVDRKSDISSFRDRLSQCNVIFLEDRVAVYWGEFSQVRAILRLMKEALYHSPDSDYLCLLSGSDYPLRSPQYIDDLLSRNQGREFINLVRMPCEAVGKPLDRLHQYRLQTPHGSQLVIRTVALLNWLISDRLRLRRDYSRVLNGLTPYAGSEWWTLTGDACRHVLSFIDRRPDVVTFFKNVYAPDESFFQTIIGNSEFATRQVRNLTFADWSRPTGGPAIIDEDHLEGFLKAECVMADDVYGRGELVFARKFTDDSSHLTDFIDAHIVKRDTGGSVPGSTGSRLAHALEQ